MEITEARKEVRRLRKEIEKHNRLYYLDARPEISDREFDRMLAELEALEKKFPELVTKSSPTRRVGASSRHARARHAVPMLSLENTYSPEEIIAFDKRVGAPRYAVEPKIDGAAVSITYRDGKFAEAATRGDGFTGEDVTANVATIRELPARINLKGELLLRGEIYIAKKRFAEIVAEMTEAGEQAFANPRNTAAGTLKLLDPKIVERRNLQIFIHSVADDSADHLETLERLEKAGLPVIPHRRAFSKIEDLIERLPDFERRRHDYAFETDGLVIKVDSAHARRELGERSRSPRWAIAYKFEPEIAETYLRAIELQVGRTGAVTPVAKFDPVWLAGTTVTSSTLHNEDEIRRLDVRVGDRIKVQKAGEIIPQVIGVIPSPKRAKPFAMPKECPICGSELVRPEEQVRWRCISPACPATLAAKILHFGSRGAMKIDGLGPAVVEGLLAAKLIHDAADLYSLTLEKLETLPRMGEKSAINLLRAVDASRKQPLDRLIFALGIPGVGEATGRDLANTFGSIEKLAKTDIDQLIAVPEIGELTANAILAFFDNAAARALIEKLEKAGVTMRQAALKTKKSPLTGKRVVITGSVPGLERREAEEAARRLGAITQSSVSKKTDLVIFGDAAGSKLEKARELGIALLPAEEFVKLV